MIICCMKCHLRFDDEFRDTICPHDAFPANDGNNNFRVHHDSALFKYPEEKCPGHVSWFKDNKRCGRCGVDIRELAPDDIS